MVAPPIEELDLVGPLQVFSSVNRLAGHAIYSIEVVTAGKQMAVSGESGMLTFTAQGRFEDVNGKFDSVLLVCGVGNRTARDPALFSWLRKAAAVVRRLGAVCVGSFLLAEAGLLNGKRATLTSGCIGERFVHLRTILRIFTVVFARMLERG